MSGSGLSVTDNLKNFNFIENEYFHSLSNFIFGRICEFLPVVRFVRGLLACDLLTEFDCRIVSKFSIEIFDSFVPYTGCDVQRCKN